jgi:hypothetical protein
MNGSKTRGRTIELAGRHYLASQLLAAGLHVAEPIVDVGVDLIMWAEGSTSFVPLQLKCTEGCRFGIWKKYEGSGALIVWIWRVTRPAETEVFALDYQQAVALLEPLGWVNSPSWTARGGVGWPLKKAADIAWLKPFKMDPKRWQELVVARTQRRL